MRRIIRLLAGPRATLVLTVGGVFCLVLALIVPQEGAGSEALEALPYPVRLVAQSLGFNHVFESLWFKFGLTVLFVNLLLGAVLHWRPRSSKKKLELLAQVDTQVLLGWGRRHFSRVRHAEAGQFELSVGQTSLWLKRIARLGFLAVLVGFVLDLSGTFVGRMRIEEGRKLGFVEQVRGPPPPSWQPLQEHGRPLPGFFIPGFEIANQRTEIRFEGAVPKNVSSRVALTVDGGTLREERVSIHAPIFFRDVGIYQKSFSNTGILGATVVAEDQTLEVQERFSKASPGIDYPLGEGSFRVLDLKPHASSMGDAAFLELKEDKRPLRRFWIHEKFVAAPGGGRYQFRIEKIEPKFSTELLVVWERGGTLIAIGAWLILVGLLGFVRPYSMRLSLQNKEGTLTGVSRSSDETMHDYALDTLMQDLVHDMGSAAEWKVH